LWQRDVQDAKVALTIVTHPEVHFHFTPTPASWLNQVEVWFSILTAKALRGVSFRSVKELISQIDAFIAAYNQEAAPCGWTRINLETAMADPLF
jgi:transposase